MWLDSFLITLLNIFDKKPADSASNEVTDKFKVMFTTVDAFMFVGQLVKEAPPPVACAPKTILL